MQCFFMPLKTRAALNQHNFLLVHMRCDTMLVQGCTGVTDSGPTLNRHWVSLSCMPTRRIVVTSPQQEALLSVE